jgi:hypothetical protein
MPRCRALRNRALRNRALRNRALRNRALRNRALRNTVLLTAVICCLPAVGGAAADSATAPSQPAQHVPVFAYYYMWMHGSYWSSNKLDYPVEPFPGNYNSSNPAVMNWQITQAKAAGITGFIVSWKDTPLYRIIIPRLEKVANQDNFRLAMEYEGLDYSRLPLPVAEVGRDFKYFASHYAANRAWYRIGGKPLTMLSGSAEFSGAAVCRVTTPVRHAILVLAEANGVAEFQRLAGCTDGDAYYWSSGSPATYPGWGGKLRAMGAAVHEDDQLWLAPFAPGFNDTQTGGQIIVPRRGGATLRAEYAAASRSAPDVLGLISWNEWTENTYVEPSLAFGHSYVHVLRALLSRASP